MHTEESQEDQVLPSPLPKYSGKRKGWTTESARAALAIRYAKAATAKANPTPTLEPSQPLESQAKISQHDWVKIEAQLRKTIRDEQRKPLIKASTIRELVWSAGVARDKAFPKVAEDAPKLVVPDVLLDKLLILVSRDTVTHVDVMPHTQDAPVLS